MSRKTEPIKFVAALSDIHPRVKTTKAGIIRYMDIRIVSDNPTALSRTLTPLLGEAINVKITPVEPTLLLELERKKRDRGGRREPE